MKHFLTKFGQGEGKMSTSYPLLNSYLTLTCPLHPLRKVLTLCVLLFVLGSLNVWGETVTLTLDKLGANLTSTSNTNVATTNITATGGSTESYTLNYLGGKKQDDAILLAKGSNGGTSFISNKTAMPGDIQSVKVYINTNASGSATYHCAFSTTECTSRYVTGSTAQNITGGNNHTYNCSVSGARYFCVALGANYNGQVLKIDVTYSGGTDKPAPSAEPESNSIDVVAAGGSGTINVTYSNFEVAVSAVQFYDQTGKSEVDAPSWMTAETDEENNNIQYSVQANSGEARTAYLKVYALNDDSDELYSSLITISQAEYVAPFDGLKLIFDVSSNPGEWPTDNSTTTSNYTYTLNEVDYTFALNNVKCNSGYLMLTWVAKLGLPAISGYKLVKVEATNSGACSTSTKVKVSSDVNGDNVVSGGTEQTWATQSSTYTYTLTGTEENTMYYLYVTNKNCQITELVLYYVEAEAAAVATPSISGEDNFLNSTEVSMTCATEGAAIYYTTTESAKATPATSGDWAAYDSENKPSFSATTTVWAAAKKDAAWSSVAEKTFTKATVLSVAEALAIINAWSSNQTSTQDYYVAGTVSTVTSLTVGGTGEYYISDDGTTTTQLQVYKGLWIGGDNFSSTDQLYVGDDVTVKGKLRKYSSYKELDQNNEVIAHKPIARLAWSDASYNAEIDGSNSFPTLTNTNSVSVTYSSSNTDAATINASTGAIELVAEGSTTITATFAGNESYKANSASYTLNVAAAVIRADISFEENGGSAVADLTQQSNLPNPLPATTKAGKNFGGWYTDSEFNTPAVAGAAVASTDAITLYAKWLEPYTVAQALAMIDELEDGGYSATEVYVSGIVCTASTSLYSSKYLCYYISADGTEDTRLYVFDGLDENGAAFTDITDIQVLDEVVVYGKLQKYVKNEIITPEIAKDNVIYSLNRKADAGLAWSADEAEATIGEENTFPNLTNDNAVAVTYSSSETDYATIDASTGEITLVAAGQTTITATFAGDATYKAASVSYTLTVKPVVVHGSITYVENGGEEVADVADATELPDPLPTTTKDGHKFMGWYTDSELTTPAVAGAALTGNITLYAAWEEISAWATTYTSNLDDVNNGGSIVKFYGDDKEYNAIKAGTGKAAGSTIITVPAKATKLHFHAYGWNGESVTLSITAPAGVTVSPASQAISANTGIFGSTSTYTLAEGSTPETDAYFAVNLSGNNDEIELTISATSGNRFVLFGVNQEGGIVPVLDHIVVTGTATALEYEVGDVFNPAGLGANAIYTLGGVEQEPVAIDAAEIEWSFEPATIAANTTAVTVTAKYGDKSATKEVSDLTVTVPNPEIVVSASSLAFGNKAKGATVADKELTVTLKSVENAKLTITGDGASAFSVTPAALTASGTVAVSASTANVGTFNATLTISDDAGAAEAKTVALSITVEASDDLSGTWNLVTDAADLMAGMQVIVASVADGDGNLYTLGGPRGNNGDNRLAVASTSTVSGTVLNPEPGTKVLTLVDAGNGLYALQLVNGNYLCAASSSSNNLKEQTTNDANGQWTITIADGKATITAQGSYSRKLMRFNPNNDNPLFACYATNSTTGTLVTLYAKQFDYTREIAQGVLSTTCLPNGGKICGASIFEIAYMDYETDGTTPHKIYFDEVEGGIMEAGMPYVVLANEGAAKFGVYYTDNENKDAQSKKGLVGYMGEGEWLNEDDYFIYDNKFFFVSATDAANKRIHISNNRAYIKLSQVPGYNNVPVVVPAPRRRVSLGNGNNAPQVATDVENAEINEAPRKVLINGELFILRGEKMYDAKGQLVK